MDSHPAVKTSVPTPHRWRSFVLTGLFRTTSRRHRVPYRWFWSRLFTLTRGWKQPVTARIHGHDVIMNGNYTYPVTCRMYPTFNAPLIELLHQTYLAAGRPIRIVDVGAAIGDTALLLYGNASEKIAEYICIDGDAEFFSYLQHNVSPLPHCRCLRALLSSENREERALVRTHGGTASAQGTTTTAAQPLDALLQTAQIGPIDLLKIDVDGFDGEVLGGASARLHRDQPAIILEWHPKLYRQTGHEPLRVFPLLRDAGYQRLLWFNKFGAFSHYGTVDDHDDHRRLERHCHETVTDADWHYDIVVLPESRSIAEQPLADLQFASHRRSPA